MRNGLLFLSLLFCSFCFSQVSIITQHNNTYRTGWNNNETTLNHNLLLSGGFGLTGNYAVDDEVYAQPLLVRNTTIGNYTGSVLFVGTVNNSLYAFNADDPSQAAALWTVSLNPAGQRAPNVNDLVDAQQGRPCGGAYRDFAGRFGLVGTPVIDTVTNTLYVATKTIDGQGNFRAYINAIDIHTGQHKAASPQLIAAQASGNGAGNVFGVIQYDAKYQNQRPGLLLYQGTVYVASASHCDWGPYHGWVLGFDAATLGLKYSYNTTPYGWAGGIWMAGAGPSVGEDGNIYVVTGNGTTGGDNNDLTGGRSESLVKLSPQLQLLDWFTPANYDYLDQADLDYGSDGALQIPQTSLSVSGSKEGIAYVVDGNAMERFSPVNAGALDTLEFNPARIGNVHVHGSPVYANLSNGEFVYAWSESFKLRQYPFNRTTGKFSKTFSQGNRNLDFGMPGAMLSVSSNGSDTSSAIVWALFPSSGNANNEVRPGGMAAYNAADVSSGELWSSDQKASDAVGKFAKFNCATVANGKVYVPTFSKSVKVYGPLCANALTNLTYGNGDGLRGEYFSGSSAAQPFGQPDLVRLDEGVNFNWGADSPSDNISKDGFKVRWLGKLQPLTDDNYTLYVTASDGVRLYINDALLIDSWTDKSVTTHSANIALQKANQYDIRLEYYSATAPAHINLQWSATGICRQIIPASQLTALTAKCSSNGDGLLAQYYSNTQPQAPLPATPSLTQTVPAVDFNWGGGSPNGISADNFKARFTGYVQSLDSGTYAFYVTADDGVRLWVNNQLLVDGWVDQAATEYNATIRLDKCTKYPIMIEYYENGGDASCKLAWSGPAIGKQVISTAQLFSKSDGPDMTNRPIVVYPNPVHGSTINLALNTTIQTGSVAAIYDAMGRLIYRKTITDAVGNLYTLPVSLPKGLYFLRFANGSKIHNVKFEVM